MSYLTADNIEQVDDHTVVLHLDSPQIAVPEHLFHYPAQIMNYRTFEGDFIQSPVGTGPFTLEEYSEGERVVLKARTDYWQMGADGNPLPYLDEIIYIDLGGEASAEIAAFEGGDVDIVSETETTVFLGLQDNPNANIIGTPTAMTRVLRMRVDKEPWTDNNVRMALKLCQDHEKILSLAHFGEGLPGADFHVAPIHPAYCEKAIPPYDPDTARTLLEEAGYAEGLTVEIAVCSDWTDVVAYAEILKEDAAPAGFNIQINTMPESAYWDVWTECDLGITPWTHRPLGTMVLSLAYICDDEGNAVPWNETRWCDDEFTTLLKQAEGTLDVDERREIMCQLEDIQYERGSVGIPYWRNVWSIAHNKVQDFKGHPTQYDLFNEIWLKEA
jgi:peptide/nickel transport system substrate-binding protein